MDPHGPLRRRPQAVIEQTLLQHPASDAAKFLENLDDFLARLSSVQSSARPDQALSGLYLTLAPDEAMLTAEDSSDWLLRHLPFFHMLQRFLAASLRQACQVECSPPSVSLFDQQG